MLLTAGLSVTLLSLATNESARAEPVGPDCGPAVLKADGTPWACTFVDDFDASALDSSKWVPQLTATSGYHSGQECFVNTPENIAVSGGELRLTLVKEKKSFTCSSTGGNYRTQYTSGMVMTYTKFTQAFGRFEFRAKFPGGTRPGLQSSLWLWPEKLDSMSYPYSGEIDVAEWYSKYPDRVIPYVHHWYDWLDKSNVTNTNCLVDNVEDWHTYTLEWTPDAIEILYDGVTCIRTTAWTTYRAVGYAPFDKPFMMAITQMMGIGNNKPNWLFPPSYPATTTVDYVKVWS